MSKTDETTELVATRYRASCAELQRDALQTEADRMAAHLRFLHDLTTWLTGACMVLAVLFAFFVFG